MPKSSRVNITDTDNSDQIVGAGLGLAAVSGVTRRGPALRPDIIITNLTQFRKIYGGVITTSDFPFQCERILKNGGQLRINSVRHFTTITDKSTLTALPAAIALAIKDVAGSSPNSLFTAASKYAGADYNNLRLIISNPTNGKTASAFNLTLQIIGDEANATEFYQNLSVTNTDVASSHYLDEVNNNSNLAILTYLDLHTIGTQMRPLNGTYVFASGSDGGTVVQTDYIGDQGAKTGLYSFDAFDDISDIAVPVISDSSVNAALALYADGRKDLQALLHLSNTVTTAAGLVTARGVTDTQYMGVFAGGIIKTDPNTKVQTQFSEIADIININNYVDKTFFPWTSRANFVKGIIKDADGVVNNFGSPGSSADLDLLAGNQINMVINANKKVYLKGNFSGQLDNSKASYFNIVRGLIYVKKSLRPTLEKYLEEPDDIPTFNALFKEVEPFMDSLTSNRFLYKGAGVSKKGYDWNGDQNASDINSLQFNTPDDLNNGIYNIQLLLYPISSIQTINLGISLNSLSNTINFTTTLI